MTMLGRLLLVLLVVVGSTFACTAKPAAGLVLAIQTDVPLPKDVDAIRLEVRTTGAPEFVNDYTVGANHLLVPATLTLLPGETPGKPVTIRLFAFQKTTLRMLRETVTSIPTSRVAMLRMPIEWLSTGMVTSGATIEDARSTCPEGQTPDQGTCVDNGIAEASLPDYEPGAVFGGGDGSGSGGCYNLLACFAQSIAVEVQASNCSVADPGGSNVNVAMALAASTTDGQCGASGCLVPVPSGRAGWSRANGRIVLPQAVCTRMTNGTVSAVRVSTSCATSNGDAPLCGDWSSVQSPSIDGGAGSDGGGADGGVVDECVPPTGSGTVHTGGVQSGKDEIWTADGSPHVVAFDASVYATITLEPCAKVQIGSKAQKASISLFQNGRIVGQGTPTRRITISGPPDGSTWTNIRTTSQSASGAVSLAYTTLRGGGDPGSNPTFAGMLYTTIKDAFDLQHVTIEGSKSNGVVLQAAGSFMSTSTYLVVTGSTGYPVVVSPQNVDTVPAGTYTGNTLSEILLGAEDVITSTTMRARGVPYHVGFSGSANELRVQANAGVATLVIEKGVTIRFDPGASFLVPSNLGTSPATGALVAVGTDAEPIVFTSAKSAPAAGDWHGLTFGNIPNASNALEFVRVAYAGGVSTAQSGSCDPANRYAAISFRQQPPSRFISNTTISDSAGDGVNRGWTTPGTPVDFLPTNTFTGIKNCRQTNPKIAACTECTN